MLCAVYKTRKKEGMYLYVPGKNAFDDVPDVLMDKFGNPELVMLVALDKHHRLAGVDKNDVKGAIEEKGFYLQMPPKQEDLLASHRQSLGMPPHVDKKC
ncbi:YcgL domain-containing protein [Aestuariibacter sp. A3R04]|uniref:YcgL domain-containing protein n=1 Tax=Aestuariibacter sp. A3R04 TaxID=2841571 RepID=UPI001C08282E|nr:YcgL domain-containing protein [Aestuariibacter sp. A3R04]MBU3023330.1 YcgL domain-containing protein [Aestuariibacter sp. A3R04]